MDRKKSMEKKSNDYILAKYDVSGIQSYIFATNRLRENAGASYQVTRILEEFLPEAMKGVLSDNGEVKTVITKWDRQDSLSLPEDEGIQAEIVYIGGGNAVVLYRTKEQYIKVGQNLGRKVAENCQGLYLAAACIDTKLIDFRSDMKRLDDRLAEYKQKMVRQPVMALFPVVERDHLSHHPITHSIRYEKVDKVSIDYLTEIQYQKRYAYEQIQTWRYEQIHGSQKARSENVGDQKERGQVGDSSSYGFKWLYPEIGEGAEYAYPEEAEMLCRKTGEDSYVAVVHIDGNGMGAQVKEIMDTHMEYKKGVPLLRKKSKEIAMLFGKTYEEVLRKLWVHQNELVKESEDGEKILPLRPILLDGDDFTFICTADLAIPIAAGFMGQLSLLQKEKSKKITACAGIAFVHSHFPFYEAYKIAEESCSRAKKKWYGEKQLRKERGNSEDPEEGYLDFEVIKGSEIGAFQGDEEWQARPYAVREQIKEEEPGSLSILYEVLKKMEDWPSNRLHKIYHAMQRGEVEVDNLQREYQSRGYHIEKLAGNLNWQESPLFDALEVRGMCRLDILKEFLNIQEEVSR